MNRKFFIAGVVFMLLITAIRPVVTLQLNRLIASTFVLLLGLFWIYGGKWFADWYRPTYEREFREGPGQRMGWDVLWMILSNRAPILYAFFGSPMGWFFTGWGSVGLLDAVLFP